jgi:hypothetical protein
MKIYIHTEGREELAAADLDGDAQVLAVAEEHGGEGAAVWLESVDEPLSSELTLLEAGVGERAHVYVGKPRTIAVTVRFNGVNKEHDFKPSQTVERVFAWAVGPEGFNLEARERPRHALSACGQGEPADTTAHIGSLTSEGELCFDLGPKHRFEGGR